MAEEDKVIDPHKEKKFLNRRGLEHFIIEISKRVARQVVFASQSDWETTDPESPSYIWNKPEVITTDTTELKNYYTKEIVDEKIEEAKCKCEINEDTFKFKADLTTTTGVGKYQTSKEEPMITIEAKDKTFKEVWDDIFNEEMNPETVAPTIKANVSASQVEVGATTSLSISGTYSEGSYSYDPTTGAAPSTYSITINGTEVATTATYSDSAYVLTDSAQTVKYTVGYTDGIVPHTNVGNEYPDGRIKASTIAATGSIPAGFRYHYASFMNPEFTLESLTSDIVKSSELKKKSTEKALGTLKVEDVEKTSIMVAVLKGKKITVTLPLSFDLDVTDQFNKIGSMQVNGATEGTGTEYDIYKFTSTVMTPEAEYKITIA